MAIVICLVIVWPACIPPRVLPKQTGKPESRPHPTREQLHALMADASDYVPDPVNEITLRTMPRLILPGGYVWASCVVPRHYDAGRIELRGNGQAIENPLDRLETRMLLGPFGCGGHEIVCTVTTFRGVEHRRVQLETGECGG